MKKIFAFSFLSLMAVTGGARAEVEQYNLNLATAEYVDGVREELSGWISNRVHTSDVAESGDTVAEASKDRYIPTVARMEAAIEDAVDGVDTSGLVAKTQVVAKAGDAELATYAAGVQAGTGTVDSAQNTNIANVNAVAANFVPNVATTYKDDFFEIEETAMRPGLYTIMVGVDESGNKTFIWQAVQNERLISSVGGQMPI